MMGYLTLNKRQTTGTILEHMEFIEVNNLGIKNNSFVKLIQLDKPYADGTAYAVHENTMNAFCSNGLFISKKAAYEKYNLMLRNIGLDKIVA